MLLIHIAHSMNRLNLSHLTQFIGILLLCKTEMRRAVPSTLPRLRCTASASVQEENVSIGDPCPLFIVITLLQLVS